MNIVNVTSRMLMLLFLLLSFNVSAETEPFLVVEVGNLAIKLSNDGTGIVNNIPCSDCDKHYLRITKDSGARKNGVEVDIQEVKKRAGKTIGISFNPETREVQNFFWYER